MKASALAILTGLCASTLLCSPAPAAIHGVTAGKVGVIDNSDTAYGFSAFSGQWTQTTLESPVIVRKAGLYIAYLRTSQKIYTYNPTGNRWVKTTYIGPILGEDAQSSTAVVWNNNEAHANATLWTIWKQQSFGPGNSPRGGGSAGTFAAVWCTQAAYAYNASNGNWHSVALNGPPIGGIARDGLGLVWTFSDAYAFDPASSSWSPLDLGTPEGVSAAGSGKVGLVWGGGSGQAFSAYLDQWVGLDSITPWLGGTASGDVALLWTASGGYAFNAQTAVWTPILLSPSAVPGGDDASAWTGGFSVRPNPASRDGSDGIHFEVPTPGAWRLEVFDVTGARVHQIDATASTETSFVWDARDSRGARLAAGAYWVRASDGDREESRRFVIVD